MLLKDVLKIDVFKGSNIVAGKGGLNNKVKRISTIEVTSDELIKWAKGEELLLTCFYSIANNIEQQVRILRSLSSRKIAGVIICHIGLYLPEVSKELIAEADTIKLPLIVMPPETTFEEILSSVMQELLNIRNNDLSMALQVQRTINMMVRQNERMEPILKFLSDVLHKKICFLDSQNHRIGADSNNREVPKNFFIIPETDNIPEISYEDKCLRYAIICYRYYYGSIVVFDVNEAEKDRLELILSNTVLPISFMNLRKAAVFSKNESAYIKFFSSLKDGHHKSVAELCEQAEMIGINLYEYNRLMVMEFSDIRGRNYIGRIKEIISKDHKKNELFAFSTTIVLLLYSDQTRDEKNRAITICNSITKIFGDIDIQIGISNVWKVVAEINGAYSQALRAIKLGGFLFKNNKYALFHDLGVFATLYDHYEPSRDGEGVVQDIRILQNYDDTHGSRYMETLKALSLSNESNESIAKTMHVHKNTLIYRKQKIIELLGHDPFSMPLKFNYQAFFITEQLMVI